MERKLQGRTLAFCFLVFLVFLSPSILTMKVANAQSSWLHVDGKYIKDEQGTTIILHGVNFIGYQVNEYLTQGYSDHTEADYQRIASWGFNVVRLAISWQHIEAVEGIYDESYFTNFVDRDIEWAQKYGIHVIIDFAKWGWSPYFNYTARGYGLPGWLFYGYPDSQEGQSKAIDDFWLGKAPGGAPATPQNPSMQDRMIQVWKYIAGRYKNNPTVIAYDLFNEPASGTLGVEATSDYLYPFFERLIGEIKTVDSNHIFIYQPIAGMWDNSPRPLNTPNTIFSVHIYPGYYDETRTGYSGEISVLEKQLQGYLNLPQSNPSKNWNIPILTGEFGPSQSQFYLNDEIWVNDMADLYNKYNIHWIYWDYGLNPGNKWSVVNPDRTEVTERADSLDKPYPRLSSIPPMEFSFDRDTKLFEVEFNGDGNVETEIYVPYRYYQNSFSVDCNSSQWTKNWDESNRILRVDVSLQGTMRITINSGLAAQDKALIIGKVTNAETGVAVTGATVAANGYQSTTGAGGTYSLEVPLGTYALTVSANGYQGKTQTLDASEQKTYTVDFALTPLSSNQTEPTNQPLPRNVIIIGGAAVAAGAGVTIAVLARRKRGRSVQ
jgi:hypothetical protein